VLPVPENAVTIAFGMLLAGAGEATMSSVALEILDVSLAATPDAQ
jgi:hypothetical protein